MFPPREDQNMTHASIALLPFFPNSFAARHLFSKVTCEDDKQSVTEEQLHQQLKATDN